MNRREFIEQSCLGGLAVVTGTSVLGTLGIPTIRASTRQSALKGVREIPIILAETPELEQVGGAYRLQIEDLDKDILIVRTDIETYIAVNITCTHKACQVGYKQEMDKPAYFECPCHGSKYDLTGAVLNGPAKRPLGAYQTVVKEGELLVLIPDEEESLGAPAASPDSTGK